MVHIYIWDCDSGEIRKLLTDVFDDNIFNIPINQDSEYHYISYVTDCCTNKHSGDIKIFVKKYFRGTTH